MAERESYKKWAKENTVVIAMRLQKSTDADILAYLEGKQKQTEFKKAMRYYIAHEAPAPEPEAPKTNSGILLKGVTMPDKRGFVDARIYGDGSVLLPCGNQLVEASAEPIKY